LENQFLLARVFGVDTQYLMITVRNPWPVGDESQGSRRPELRAITGVDGSTSLAARGRGAAASLWLYGFPDDASLLDFEVDFEGCPGLPCYISPPFEGGAFQVNVLLPRGIRAGRVPVKILFRGKVLVEHCEIEVYSPTHLVPGLLRLTDAVDMGSSVIRNDAAKVIVENIEDPTCVEFFVDGIPCRCVDFDCVDQIAMAFEFDFDLPGSMTPGAHVLEVVANGKSLPPVPFSAAVPK
jgi:hypothetical protein